MKNKTNNNKNTNFSNWRKLTLTIAISLIFILFIGFGIEAFYDSPKYDDYCSSATNPTTQKTKESCEENGGIWNADEYSKKIPPINDDEFICTDGGKTDEGKSILYCDSSNSDVSIVTETEPGWCDMYSKCGEEYRAVNDLYNRNVFIICFIIGIITIFAGTMLRKESVGTGILIGGVLTVLYGTVRHWSELGDFVRFFLLGVVLILLIYLGYKKISD